MPRRWPGADTACIWWIRCRCTWSRHASRPAGRPEFFTTAYFHTPDGLAGEIEQAGFTGIAVYGVEGPGWPLREEWADPQRREQILFAARSAETQPSLTGFSKHLIAAATKP
jgi:hypothetical protein